MDSTDTANKELKMQKYDQMLSEINKTTFKYIERSFYSHLPMSAVSGDAS